MNAQQKNELVERAVDAALNAGCLAIQEALGVETGDVAAMRFSGTASRRALMNTFAEYLQIEALQKSEASGNVEAQPRQYWRTSILVEVLSEDRPVTSKTALEVIAEEIDTGACVGRVTDVACVRLTRVEVDDNLSEFGSEPDFLMP